MNTGIKPVIEDIVVVADVITQKLQDVYYLHQSDELVQAMAQVEGSKGHLTAFLHSLETTPTIVDTMDEVEAAPKIADTIVGCDGVVAPEGNLVNLTTIERKRYLLDKLEVVGVMIAQVEQLTLDKINRICYHLKMIETIVLEGDGDE